MRKPTNYFEQSINKLDTIISGLIEKQKITPKPTNKNYECEWITIHFEIYRKIEDRKHVVAAFGHKMSEEFKNPSYVFIDEFLEVLEDNGEIEKRVYT